MRHKNIACTLFSLAFLVLSQSAVFPATTDLATESEGKPIRDQQPVPPGAVVQPPAPAGGADLWNRVSSGITGPRIGLTLAGGGARGAAHIGVLKVLERNGIKPHFIVGASMGSVVGALYAAGVPVSEIERLLVSGEMKKAYFPNSFAVQALKYVPPYMLKRLIGMKPEIGLYRGDSIARFVNSHLPPGVNSIEQFPIPFAAIGVNVLDTRPQWITKGDPGQAAQASSTVPFLYRPLSMEGKVLVDGGVRENLPTEPAKALAPTVIAVRLHSSLEARPEKEFNGLISYGDRIMRILMAEIEQTAVGKADILIEPNVADTKMYEFSAEEVRKAIAAGEAAAEKMLPQIQQRISATKNRTALRSD